MVYDYILVVLRLFVGLITNKIMILSALTGLGIYLLWVFLAVAFSFGRKFYKRCDKLRKFVNKNEKSEENFNIIMEKSRKISSGLYAGIKTFKRNGAGFPSNYISKSNALDSEVTGGIFNHGKSFMRAYILVTSLFLLLMNFAYLGADKVLTGTLVAEIAILPLIYFVVIRLFYFLYTSTQQQFYKIDVEKFNELVDALDEKYGSKAQMVFASEEKASETLTVKNDEDSLEKVEPQQEAETENLTETENAKLEETADNEEKITEPEKTLDDYDFFKKKNIDVEKLVNEVPTASSSSALPFIDVDSDFEIKDDKDEAKPNNVFVEDENLTQNRANEMDEKTAETEEVSDDVFAGFGSFDLKNDQPTTQNVNVSEDTPSLSHLKSGSQNNEFNDSEKAAWQKNETKTEDDEIASLVEMFKTDIPAKSEPKPVIKENNRSVGVSHKSLREKLAQSEKNTITKSNFASNKTQLNNNAAAGSKYNNVQSSANNRSNQMSNFLNLKGSNLDTDPFGSGLASQGNFYGGFNGKNDKTTQEQLEKIKSVKPLTKRPVIRQSKPAEAVNKPASVEVVLKPERENVESQSANVTLKPKPEVQIKPVEINRPVQPKAEERIASEAYETAKPVKEPEAKPVVVEEKKPEPKANAIAATSGAVKGKRGRPAKQIFDENVTIKNDEEFETVLLRAEKLMRKSEEGLSASQSKRVEKELKTLLDAMNKYKESI